METRRVRLVKKGAEAELWFGYWLGLPSIFKVRREKPYRPAELDRWVRVRRTVTEARLLHEAYLAGLAVPSLYHVDLDKTMIVMEYVEGPTAKELVEGGYKDLEWLFREMGRGIGLLHSRRVVHGDLTTSNVIMRGSKLYFIDFGLGDKNARLEDMGVDLHLFLRALESTHYDVASRAFEWAMEGYAEVVGESQAKAVREKVREIRMRGRHVMERRKRKPFPV